MSIDVHEMSCTDPSGQQAALRMTEGLGETRHEDNL